MADAASIWGVAHTASIWGVEDAASIWGVADAASIWGDAGRADASCVGHDFLFECFQLFLQFRPPHFGGFQFGGYFR